MDNEDDGSEEDLYSLIYYIFNATLVNESLRDGRDARFKKS